MLDPPLQLICNAAEDGHVILKTTHLHGSQLMGMTNCVRLAALRSGKTQHCSKRQSSKLHNQGLLPVTHLLWYHPKPLMLMLALP